MGYLVVTVGGIASVIVNVFVVFAVTRAVHSEWLRSFVGSFIASNLDSTSVYILASGLTIACFYSMRRVPYLIAAKLEQR